MTQPAAVQQPLRRLLQCRYANEISFTKLYVMEIPELLDLLRREGAYEYPTCPNEANHTKAGTSTMALKDRGGGHYRFHCGKRTGHNSQCGTSISIRKGLPFDRSNCPENQLVAGVCKFLDNVEFQIMVKDLGWNSKTVQSLRRKCSRVCVLAEAMEDDVVGGPGIVVEYDETIIGKGSHWIVGVYERHSGRLFTELVPGGEKPTLQYIIQYIKKHVRPGSTVMTDCMMFGVVDENLDAGHPFMKYKKVVEIRLDLVNAGYDHIVVDHGAGVFDDPVTGANTHGIDAHWLWLKRSMPQSPHAKCLHWYIAKYNFTRRARLAGRDPTIAFFCAWRQLLESGYTVDDLKAAEDDEDDEDTEPFEGEDDEDTEPLQYE